MGNPVKKVDPPEKPQKEMVILSEIQISQLLVTAKNHRLEALFHLAISTGMREFGITWLAVEGSRLDQTNSEG